MRLFFVAFAASTCLFSLTGWGKESLPTILPRSTQAPNIDGVIDEKEWGNAVYLGKIPVPDEENPLPQTEAWVALGPAHLYIAIRCAEPAPEKIKASVLADEIKGAVWNDDSAEIFLDLGNTGQTIFQLVANTDGTIYDSQIVRLQQVPTGWTSGAIVRTRIGKTAWEMEIALPMDPTGHRPVRGEVISLNIGRNRHAGEKRQQASYAGKNFIFPKHFIPLLVEGPIVAGDLALISPKRGPFLSKTAGRWEFKIVSGEPDPGKLAITFPQSTAALAKGPLLKKGERYISWPFPAGQEKGMNHALITHEGQPVFTSGYAIQSSQTPDRIAKTAKPLFEELLEARPEGLSKKGIINWAHELNRPSVRRVPFRAGMAYEQERTPYQEYARDRTLLITTLGAIRQNPQGMRLAQEYGISWVVYLRSGAAAQQGAPTFGKPGSKARLWFLDPRSKQAFLDNARETIGLSKEYPNIRWLFVGDETWEHLHQALLLALDQKESYPELLAADREIREKYGFGKYGLPESKTDTNPFRWIATYRWEVDQMMELAGKVKEMIRESAPEMKLLSWDPMTGHRPYAVGRWGEVFDVVTGQIYPAKDTRRDHVGFTTKFYADLSGAGEIWPVPHIEHYPASFTGSEVEEILSQAFRAGATGLHLWTADHLNENVRKSGTSINDRIGAPERWNVVRSVIDRLAVPFRVKQPQADTAIFYSNTSYQGTGAPMTFSLNNQVEWIYTILGPRLRSALRFIDDVAVPRNPESLSQYKVIYIPYMPIADDKEYEALEKYVQAGGNLVVCDPEAFRHRSDGSARTSGTLLPPLASKQAGEPQRLISRLGSKPGELPPLGPAYRLEEGKGEALATYPDGAPAIIQTALGKGSVISFGENPLVSNVIADPHWITLFASLQQRLGASKDHDVWRFRFPKVPPVKSSRPEGDCLTGNYFEWSLSEAKPIANAVIGGSYLLEGVDTGGAEPAGQAIRFTEGRLSDRIKGANAPVDAETSDYLLLCKAQEPWTISYSFDQPANVKTARIFYSGTLPAGWCEVSTDGKEWRKAGAWETASIPGRHDVGMQTVAVAGENAPYLRLRFGATAKNGFSLVEIDLWGGR